MKLGITETALRDAHQSLLATRMRTEDMLPIAEKLDAVGYHSLEVWGGATFDTALRFLKEDPWERLRALRQRITKTPLQMLLRGQNVVGYRHYADDVVELFCQKAVENGVRFFRIFDAVNDTRNLEVAFRTVKAAGGHVQGTISYTISPVFTAQTCVDMARTMVQMGADSICLKDMAGLLSPQAADEIIGRLRREVSLPLAIHSHSTSGMADMAYIKAIEAGVDTIDTAISSMALNTSHPPTETFVATYRGTDRDTGLNLELLTEIAEYFAGVRKRYAPFEGQAAPVDANVLLHQTPGGMISNLLNQLREMGAIQRLQEVLEEMPRVREELGYPPLVTPTSQIVGTQAVLNVLYGRYKVVPKEVKAYVQGYYGASPAPLNPEVQARVLKGAQPIAGRPGDFIEPELENARAEIGELARSDEDVLSFVLFPEPARAFFKWREAGGVAEPEVVAAIAAAMDARRRASAPPSAPAVPAAGDRNPWRLMGRQHMMRGGS